MSLTDELLVSLVDGQVPECGGDSTHHPVHLHPEELHQDGQPLLFPDSGPDVYRRLPVTGRQVLDSAGRRLQRLRVGTVGEEVEVGPDHLRLPQELHPFEGARPSGSTRTLAVGALAVGRSVAVLLVLLVFRAAGAEAAQIITETKL